jgi:hypothetical protein
MDNNTKDIFHAIYCLLNLVTLESGDKDVLVDVIHFCFEIQVRTSASTTQTIYARTFILVYPHQHVGFQQQPPSNVAEKTLAYQSP